MVRVVWRCDRGPMRPGSGARDGPAGSGRSADGVARSDAPVTPGPTQLMSLEALAVDRVVVDPGVCGLGRVGVSRPTPGQVPGIGV